MKTLISKFAMLASLMLAPIGLLAQGNSQSVLDVGFEDGKIPSGWEILHERGSQDWTIVSDNSFEGSHHITLKNPTTLQQNYRSLLISPQMDITSVPTPVVIFAHKQPQRTGDFDTLRLLYRTAPDRQWNELASFPNVIDDWRMDTIMINNPSATFQIAFDGSDNMGGGIDIDAISVRPSPRCEQPSNISISSPTDVSCTLNWYAGFEALKIKVKVSTKELTPEQLAAPGKPDGLIIDTLLPGTDINMSVEGLTPGTKYFAYIQSVCTNGNSEWSDVFSFSTTYKVSLPFYEDFNMPYQASINNYPEHWICGTSTGEQSPFINTKTISTNWHMYSRDASTALCFSENDETHAITAGQWSYAATPIIDIENIQDAYVTFEARTFNPTPTGNINEITLGVMTDPNSFETFVPVDTFECSVMKEYYTFSISLEKYFGNGKYIALASDFDQGNIIYIDNFRVENISGCKTPANVKVKVPSATELEISWDAFGAPSADIVLTKTYTYPSPEPVEEVDTVKVIKGVPTDKPYTVSGLTPWSEYYVYVRNVNGDNKSPWSVGIHRRMPEKITAESMSFDFEINENDPSTFYNNMPYPDGLQNKMVNGVLTIFENNYPRIIQGNSLQGNSHSKQYALQINMSKADSCVAAIFPEIEDIREYRVKFWYYNTGSTNNYANIMVGIMSDASDISTFYPIDTILSESRYALHTVEFDKYPENLDGRFLALIGDISVNPHLIPADGYSYVISYLSIDDLTLEKIPACREPYDVSVTSSTNTVELNWEKTADAYNIRLFTDTLSVSQLENPDFQFTFSANDVTELPIKIENLLAQERRYYYYIQPVCGGVEGDWSTGEWFKTQCADINKLPYHMNFDGYEHKGANNPEFAIPCLYTQIEQFNNRFFPYINNRQYSYNGYSSLHLEASNQIKNQSSPQETYVAFPEMEIDNVNKLQMSFALHAVLAQTEPVEIGVMTDPNDISSFEKYTTVKPEKIGEFHEIVVPFDRYKGNGKYIAFHIKPDSSLVAVNIDSVVIEPIRCRKADSLTTLNLTTSSVELAWKDGNPGSWDLVVSTQPLSYQQLDNAIVGTDGVVFSQNVDKNPYILNEGLNTNTSYYFYVRGVCSETDKAAWPFKPGEFRTPCTPLALGDQSLQDFEPGEGTYFDCWTFGNSSLSNPAEGEKIYIPCRSELYKHNGKNSLQFYTTKKYNGAYAVSPLLEVDDIRTVEVSFWGSATEKYSNPDKYGRILVVGVTSSPYNLSSFVPLDTLYAYGDEQPYRARFDRYKSDDPEGGKYVMFRSEYDGDNYFFIDDLRFDIVGECASPVDLNITETTVNSAKISWRGGSAPYTVVYSDKQLTAEELDGGAGTLVADDIKTTEAEITGLNARTTYFVYVKSGCGESVWSAPLRFSTECMASHALPFYDNFDSNQLSGFGERPACWNSFYTRNTTDYPSLETVAYKGKSAFIYAGSNGPTLSYLVSPMLEVDDLTDCYASFYLAGNAKDQRSLIIGLVSDITDIQSISNSFVPVDTILVKSNVFEKYIIPLKAENWSAAGGHVAFCSSPELNVNSSGTQVFDGGAYIDEVEIGLYEPCPMPDFITVDSLADTEIKGSFRELGSASAWQAVCVPSGDDPSSAEPIALSAQQFAFSGLTPRTDYDIYLRSACPEAESGYSGWSTPVAVRTTNVPLSQFPFSTGFEADDPANAEWEYANDKMNYWHIGAAEFKDGQAGLYVTDDGGASSHYIVTEASTSYIYRTVEMEPGSYTVEYDWKCWGEGATDILKIGLFPTNIEIEAGNLNITPYGYGSPFTISGLPAGVHPQYIPLEGIEPVNHTQNYRLNLNEIWKHNKVNLLIPEKGLYNLVIIWINNNITGNKPSPAAVLDNISIKKSECVQPVDIRFEHTGDGSSVVTWDAINGAASQWEVFVTDNSQLFTPDESAAGDTLFIDTVSETRCSLPDIDEWALSYVFVRSLCSDGEYSPWSDKTTLRTECAVKPLGTLFDFDSPDDVITEISGQYSKHAKCFTTGNINSTNINRDQQYYPNVYSNNPRFNDVFARSGENALLFTYNTLTMAGGYIALPVFDTESLAGMQLSFWMRPVSHSSSTGILTTYNSVGNDYARKLTIGSMTDPNDFSTFKEIEVVAYPYSSQDINATTGIADDPAGTDWWRHYSIILPEDCGRYIVFYNSPDYGKTKNTMYVDDILVAPVADCAAPVSVSVDNIGSSSAELAFVHADAVGNGWELQIASKNDMSDIVLTDTLTSDDVYPVSGLAPKTQYCLRMLHLCSDTEASDWTNVVTFRTSEEVPFYEQFDKVVYIPDGWLRSISCTPSMLFAGTHTLSYVDETQAGWDRDHDAGNEFAELNTNTIMNQYLITPSIYLGNGDNMTLTFDLSVTAANSYLPADTGLMNSNKVRFVVLVSDDAGQTWKRENAMVWDNTADADHPFSSLSGEPQMMTVDMSAHKGKAVQVAFYAGNERGLYNETKYIGWVRLDNVRLNSMTTVNLTDDICETNSYDNYGFSRHYSELALGPNQMSRFALSAGGSDPDTLYNLTLNVNSLSRTYLVDSVCAGDTYNKYNFSTDIGGIQKQKFSFGGGRCDSVVYLDLKVIPIPTSTETMTICQGQHYEWNGRQLDRSGVYTDTLQATSCDCDSIATLLLTVTDAEVTPLEEAVCHDSSYDFAGQTLTESGTYRDTVIDATGCISITELTLTVLPDYRRSYTAYFCEGTEYSDENFIGVYEEGTYTNPLTSTLGGCDSTVTMTLIALSGDTSRVTETITVDQLPYTINGTDITYDAGTQPGTYVDTVTVSIDGCSEVLIHTLIVEKPSTLLDIPETATLMLTPNPVRVNESVMVHLGLTPAGREGLTVQVYSSTGALLQQFTPAGQPVTIDGLNTVGIYIVRITDGTGKVYTGKVIVR